MGEQLLEQEVSGVALKAVDGVLCIHSQGPDHSQAKRLYMHGMVYAMRIRGEEGWNGRYRHFIKWWPEREYLFCPMESLAAASKFGESVELGRAEGDTP